MVAGVPGVNKGIIMAHYFREQRPVLLEAGRRSAPHPQHVVQAPYLGLGVTESARVAYEGALQCGGVGACASWLHEEERRRTLTFFFAGNLALYDTGGHYSEGACPMPNTGRVQSPRPRVRFGCVTTRMASLLARLRTARQSWRRP